jgi:hypothetical protein
LMRIIPIKRYASKQAGPNGRFAFVRMACLDAYV